MSFIAVDIGTSFMKGAVLDLERMQLSHIAREAVPATVSGLKPMMVELEPDALVEAVRKLITKLFRQADDCQGLVVCSQMHGMVLMDEENRAAANIVPWLDQRGTTAHPTQPGTIFDAMMAQLEAADVVKLGNGLRAGLPVATLYWYKAHDCFPPNAYTAASLPDFVLSQLCQQRAPLGMEPTYAHGQGLFDLTTGDWDHALIERLGLSFLDWPVIRSLSEPVGVLEIDGQQVLCYPPVGDHQCALAGAFLREGELSLNVSTGSQVSMVTPDFQPGNYETRPYFDGQLLNTIVKVPAGRALDLLVDLLCELAQRNGAPVAEPWPLIEAAAAALPPTDLQVDLSFFDSMSGREGQIHNIREDNLSVGHLFRAAFQSMAINYYNCAQRLAPDQSWRNLVFSGGLAQKLPLLRQIILAQLPGAYRLCAASEDTLLGLLSIALYCSGSATSVQHAIEQVQQAQEAAHSG